MTTLIGTADRERRRLLAREAMASIRAERKAVCAERGHHSFSFSHFGPLGNAWDYCTVCMKSKVHPNDE